MSVDTHSIGKKSRETATWPDAAPLVRDGSHRLVPGARRRARRNTGFALAILTSCHRSAMLRIVSKATVYLDDDLHQALRLKAAETRESMSELVNEAVRAVLSEDLEDLEDWKKRRNEEPIAYEEFRKKQSAGS